MQKNIISLLRLPNCLLLLINFLLLLFLSLHLPRLLLPLSHAPPLPLVSYQASDQLSE